MESVSDEYSNKFEKELVEMNKELKLELEEIYAHFDIAMAKQRVFNCFENFDSISSRSFRLKECSYEFQNRIEKLLEFPFDQTDLNEIEVEMDAYRQTLVGLIDSSHFLAEGKIQQINEKLALSDFQKLQGLNQNEFRLEKELVKSKLLRIEFLVASHLLMEINYDVSVFKLD